MNHRCSFLLNTRTIRPTMQAYTFSSTGHFKIHYDITGQDAPSQTDLNSNSIPDYVDEVAIAAENARNIIVNDMNFLPEIPDEDGVYDIYIEDRPSYAYGINYSDNLIVGASWIVIDNEYEEGEFLTSGLNTMRLTVAHEFFHAVQRAYSIHPGNTDGYFWELTATWIEDIVVPTGNDYIYWVGPFFNNPNQNLSNTDGYSVALFGHYLVSIIENEENQINSNIIRYIWEDIQNGSNAFASIENVLENQYNKSFAYAWGDFCSRNHYNGVYNNMDNGIYYYEDQIDINSNLNINEIVLNGNYSSGNVIFNNDSAEFKNFTVNETASIDFVNFSSDNDLEFLEFIAIKSNDNTNNYIIYAGDDSNSNDGPYIINPNDNVILSFTGSQQTTILNFDVIHNTTIQQIDGDINLDGVVNIVDVITLVNNILYDSSSLTENQIDVADLSQDGILNIVDILLMIDVILNS